MKEIILSILYLSGAVGSVLVLVIFLLWLIGGKGARIRVNKKIKDERN
jgi:hypothetical protein